MVEHHSKNIQNVILRELFKANHTIKIAVAWFTNDLLFQPLILKLIAGVKVELILNQDDINLSPNGLDFNEFTTNGGLLYWNDSKKLLHDKFCVIDDDVVISGSYNWTNKAEFNDESITIFKNEEKTSSFYLELFQKLSKKYTTSDNKCVVSGERHIVRFNLYPKLKFYSSIIVRKVKDIILFAQEEKDGLYAIIDNTTYLPKTEYIFEELSYFSFHKSLKKNCIWIKQGAKWGLYNVSTLSYIIPPTYDEIKGYYHFSGTTGDLVIVKFNNKYGLYNSSGECILKCCYDEIRYIGDYGDDVLFIKNGKCGLLYCNGITTNITQCIYDLHSEWSYLCENTYKVRLGDRYTLIYKGKVVSNLLFEDIKSTFFKSDMIQTKNDGKLGLVQNNGKIILECLFDKIDKYDVGTNELIIVMNNGKYGLFSCDGKTILPTLCDEIEKILYGGDDYVILFKINEKFGMILPNGDILLDAIYDNISQSIEIYNKYMSSSGFVRPIVISRNRYSPSKDEFILQKDNRYGLYSIILKKDKECVHYSLKDLYDSKDREKKLFWLELENKYKNIK